MNGDLEQFTVENTFNPDSRLITMRCYLIGLHHNDMPTELMPIDARMLKAARRFYRRLSDEDKLIIDSYSDIQICQSMDLKKRNKRFKTLCKMLLCETGNESKYTMLPPDQAEEGLKNNESY